MKKVILKRLVATGLIVQSVLLISFVSFILPSVSYADGISVTEDRKHVREAHTTIKLTRKQIQDVERRRVVILNDSQLRPLKKMHEKTPSKIRVVSSRWDDCTCGMGLYAIWCRPGEIDIPNRVLESQKEEEEYLKQHPEENGKEEGGETGEKDDYEGKAVILDSKGRMFIEGKMTDEKELHSVIDRLSASKASSKSIYLDIPPPVSGKTDRKIRELVNRVEEYANKKGVGFWALGLSLEKQLKEGR